MTFVRSDHELGYIKPRRRPHTALASDRRAPSRGYSLRPIQAWRGASVGDETLRTLRRKQDDRASIARPARAGRTDLATLRQGVHCLQSAGGAAAQSAFQLRRGYAAARP